jgi:hypothetical protein
MRRAAVSGLVVVALAVPAGCGGKTTTEKLAEWVARWSDDAAHGTKRPPTFHIPRPPPVVIGGAASDYGRSVGRSVATLAEQVAEAYRESPEQARAFTKEVLCEWFGWYVQDPNRVVPDSNEFASLLTSAGLKVTFHGGPPPQQVRESADLFRDAIVNAQSETQEVRNAAIAAACSIP